MSSQQANALGHAVPGDAGPSSGAEASDTSSVVTPASKNKTSSDAHSLSTVGNASEKYCLVNYIPPISAPTSSKNIQRHHSVGGSPANAQSIASQFSSASRFPDSLANATPVTPSKGSTPTISTPGSRLAVIENALRELRLNSTSPTSSKLQRSATEPQIGSFQRYLDVKDAESSNALTDKEVSTPEAPPIMTGNCFKSSTNSPFPQRTGAGSASSLAIAPVFHPTSSSNVPTPENQLVELGFSAAELAASQAPGTPVPALISKFARSHFGIDLEVGFIAHDDGIQPLMDLHKIEWGAQYELARGVSQGWWSWADVRGHLNELRGKNADVASKVQSIMQHKRGGTSSLSDSELWKELDREQLAIMENRGRGLGLMGDWKGSRNWYGGRIQQLARLVKDGSSYKIKLEPMEKRRSFRFARMFGSRRFIHMKIAEEVLQKENTEVKRFLLKKFVLCGRTYIPFTSKEGAVYLFETNDNYHRSTQDWCGDQFRISLQTFINWHNPLEQPKNYKQVISKWAVRFVLGLSNSVPAIEFDEKNIFFINDIVASDWTKDEKPPAHKLMTDGCGFINHVALFRIAQEMGYENIPAGIQGRIDGSKGFWILHPTDKFKEPRIWVRDSQNKIENHIFDRAHKIFDLLGPSRPSPPIALSSQSIINVFANGIPLQTLVRLMEEGLEKEIAPLLDWDKPHAAISLWHAVSKAGNITGLRTQRIATALSRALGLKGRDWSFKETETGEDENSETVASSANTGRNEYSGSPASFHETAMEMLQSGFLPNINQHLCNRLGSVVKSVIAASIKKFRIPIEESLAGYIVPDPTGVLGEDEMCYYFSVPRTDLKTGLLIRYLEGDVLLGRYPIRLPSDMRKMKAVYKRELENYTDVVIVSTKGNRSAASELADGDMDGDEVITIFKEEIVQAFDNKPFTEAPEDLIDANFEPSGKVETVERFCIRIETLSPRQRSEAFVEHLITNFNEPPKGLYSMMHENATITHGYSHKDTIRLAYIFATLLDSSKTGHRLKDEVLRKDLDCFGQKSGDSNGSPLPNDILGHLKAAGTGKGDELLQRYESKKESATDRKPRDKELLLPYDEAADYANGMSDLKIMIFSEELKRIRDHVDAAYQMFSETWDEYFNPKFPNLPSNPGKKTKPPRKDLMLACSRAYAEPFEPEIIRTKNWKQVKASYAYKRSESFGFNVAFTELCQIKAAAAPEGYAPTLRTFDEGKIFSSAFLRALSRSDEDSN